MSAPAMSAPDAAHRARVPSDEMPGGQPEAKRRRTQTIAELEATVASQGRQIAELGAANAALEAENATLRKRPRLPTTSAALKQLVGVLGVHEPDLRDVLFDLVCEILPRYLARCASELPANPRGVLGTFAVTVPAGTITIAGDAFTQCEGLLQVTLPVTVTAIEAGEYIMIL